MAAPAKRVGAIVPTETGQGHYINYYALYQEALARLKKREELVARLEQLLSNLDLKNSSHGEELLRILKELRGG